MSVDTRVSAPYYTPKAGGAVANDVVGVTITNHGNQAVTVTAEFHVRRAWTTTWYALSPVVTRDCAGSAENQPYSVQMGMTVPNWSVGTDIIVGAWIDSEKPRFWTQTYTEIA